MTIVTRRLARACGLVLLFDLCLLKVNELRRLHRRKRDPVRRLVVVIRLCRKMVLLSTHPCRRWQLGPMNKTLDPRGRYDAVTAEDELFLVEPVQ